MKLRSIGCGLALAVAAGVAALLLAEAGVRLLVPQPLLHDPDAFMADPVLGARLKPGFSDRVTTTEFSSTWTINADGYRGPLAGARGTAAFRILALGDSFTFGYGVEEEQSWPRLLEEDLDGGAGPAGRVEVVNLGVGGYGTTQERLYLERMAGPLDPDLALVAFYVGNNPEDNVRTTPSPDTGSADATRAAPSPSRVERLKRWMGGRSQLYNLVSARADELLVRLGLRRLVYPFEMELLVTEPPLEVTRAWDATGRALARLGDLSRERGLPVVVLVLPMKHQVSDAVWERVQDHYARLAGGGVVFERDRPQRIMQGECVRAGLRCFDLLEGLRAAQATGGGDLYWPRDQHFNARGHEVAARLIAAWLRREHLVP